MGGLLTIEVDPNYKKCTRLPIKSVVDSRIMKSLYSRTGLDDLFCLRVADDEFSRLA